LNAHVFEHFTANGGDGNGCVRHGGFDLFRRHDYFLDATTFFRNGRQRVTGKQAAKDRRRPDRFHYDSPLLIF
jgi:hypothetical protein